MALQQAEQQRAVARGLMTTGLHLHYQWQQRAVLSCNHKRSPPQRTGGTVTFRSGAVDGWHGAGQHRCRWRLHCERGFGRQQPGPGGRLRPQPGQHHAPPTTATSVAAPAAEARTTNANRGCHTGSRGQAGAGTTSGGLQAAASGPKGASRHVAAATGCCCCGTTDTGRGCGTCNQGQAGAGAIGGSLQADISGREGTTAAGTWLPAWDAAAAGPPTPAEAAAPGFKPQGAAAAAAAAGTPSGSPGPGTGGKGSRGAPAAKPRGLPFFWLNALCNQEELSALITGRDRCALEYLRDVRYVRGPAGMAVELHFAPNPYFNNEVRGRAVRVW
ncbi:Nucleosome assembly protein 1-like 3 [Tetrabaena socialis]|uniref:Nucleosome assembly protein 1-like 3 n=1 Tax=Tetrabaena socialis TaxID=47790 RepID=A0A2J8AFE3_9CHLO|nr:Nucleosome assembly protein 1-like 3 [Tetrabaena socialis]|eukprot:PNH11240.1 Nucleosome assembly protein 1-like 3 [Tetrabaena socialis]